jgi:tripartite-type tricarboxylate transporter receptor subunit TctC
MTAAHRTRPRRAPDAYKEETMKAAFIQRARAWACALAMLGAAGAAHAAYPDHPIRLIVPFGPGGGADIVCRVLAQKLSVELGQPIIIDNRPGGGTLIGAELAAHAKPDGYTLFNGITGTMAINPSMYRHLPYDPVKDFAPVSMVAVGSNVLVVHPSLPVHTVAELIAYARARPGQLNFGSSGIGGAPHLAGELLKSRAAIDIVHVPYKGSAQAMVDLVSGHVQIMFSGLGAVMPQIKNDSLRPIAVASAERSRAMPDLPTIAETLPGFNASTWFALFAPAGTPPEIAEKLAKAIAAIMQRKDIADELLAQGYEPWVMGPQQLGAFVVDERDKWARVIADAHIPPAE